MAFIDYIDYDSASDELKKLYEKFGHSSKTPANIVRIAGPNPKAMLHHVNFFMSIMHQNSEISREQREMVAVLVSSINECHY